MSVRMGEGEWGRGGGERWHLALPVSGCCLLVFTTLPHTHPPAHPPTPRPHGRWAITGGDLGNAGVVLSGSSISLNIGAAGTTSDVRGGATYGIVVTLTDAKNQTDTIVVSAPALQGVGSDSFVATAKSSSPAAPRGRCKAGRAPRASACLVGRCAALWPQHDGNTLPPPDRTAALATGSGSLAALAYAPRRRHCPPPAPAPVYPTSHCNRHRPRLRYRRAPSSTSPHAPTRARAWLAAPPRRRPRNAPHAPTRPAGEQKHAPPVPPPLASHGGPASRVPSGFAAGGRGRGGGAKQPLPSTRACRARAHGSLLLFGACGPKTASVRLPAAPTPPLTAPQDSRRGTQMAGADRLQARTLPQRPPALPTRPPPSLPHATG